LIAKIYLTPRKKYSFGTSLDVTHSNIQDIGIALSVSETIRNVFNGAETLELSARKYRIIKRFSKPKQSAV
jgi:5-bromo-4-chloroindolyl phosphate hydrolysis protein